MNLPLARKIKELNLQLHGIRYFIKKENVKSNPVDEYLKHQVSSVSSMFSMDLDVLLSTMINIRLDKMFVKIYDGYLHPLFVYR